MCSLIRDRWNRDKILSSPKELELMESSYIKYHTYLALALHNAVQNKDADYCKFQIFVWYSQFIRITIFFKYEHLFCSQWPG